MDVYKHIFIFRCASAPMTDFQVVGMHCKARLFWFSIPRSFIFQFPSYPSFSSKRSWRKDFLWHVVVLSLDTDAMANWRPMFCKDQKMRPSTVLLVSTRGMKLEAGFTQQMWLCSAVVSIDKISCSRARPRKLQYVTSMLLMCLDESKLVLFCPNSRSKALDDP